MGRLEMLGILLAIYFIAVPLALIFGMFLFVMVLMFAALMFALTIVYCVFALISAIPFFILSVFVGL
jgi:hypothetical protein